MITNFRVFDVRATELVRHSLAALSNFGQIAFI
jgi:hypothetical protein